MADNAYSRLLEALGGDSYENRRLIDDWSHQLAAIGRQLYIFGTGEGALKAIDPYENTKDRWRKVTENGDLDPGLKHHKREERK